MTMTKQERIKECIVCGETFQDNTRPNNKKACSKKCADEARKARQRKQYRLENPKRPTQREIYYHDHLEYPFWSDERIGRNQMWKEDNPYTPERLEGIAIAKQLYNYHGGRRRRQETIDYNGDEIENHGVRVEIVKHDDRKPSDVTTYVMSPDELSEYLENKGDKV